MAERCPAPRRSPVRPPSTESVTGSTPDAARARCGRRPWAGPGIRAGSGRCPAVPPHAPPQAVHGLGPLIPGLATNRAKTSKASIMSVVVSPACRAMAGNSVAHDSGGGAKARGH